MVLPTIKNRLNNTYLKNNFENKNFNSKSKNNNNNKNIKKELKNIYNYFHPWINISYNNNDINSYISNCFDITKIRAPINNKKYRINDSKLTNKLLRDVEKHYKIANIYQKNKVTNIRFNVNDNNSNQKNIILNENNISNKNNIINYNKNILNLRCFNPFLANQNNEKNNKSLDNTYLNLNKIIQEKNDHNSRNNYYPRDFSDIKKIEKEYSSFNNSFSKISNNINKDINNEISSPKRNFKLELKNKFKTIKIKKSKKIYINENDNINDEKIGNKIEKIKPNLLFKKSETFTVLQNLDSSQENTQRINEIKDNV